MIDRYPPITGQFILDIFRNGELIEHTDEPNLVVDTSKLILSRLAGGEDLSLWAVSKIGFGSNGTKPVAGNATLTSPFIKALGSVSYPNNRSVAFIFTLEASEANDKQISEFGLLSGNRTLFARKIRNEPLPKTNEISLSGQWIINF